MHWFRRHIRTGTHLALFALALQFVLALGHVHLPERMTHGGDASATVSHAIAAATAADDHSGDHHHHHAAADYCVLCAVATQAQGMLASAAPSLSAPPQAVSAIAAAYDSQAPPALRHAAFQPRAPPTV